MSGAATTARNPTAGQAVRPSQPSNTVALWTLASGQAASGPRRASRSLDRRLDTVWLQSLVAKQSCAVALHPSLVLCSATIRSHPSATPAKYLGKLALAARDHGLVTSGLTLPFAPSSATAIEPATGTRLYLRPKLVSTQFDFTYFSLSS